MKQLTTPSGEILIIEVLEYAEYFFIGTDDKLYANYGQIDIYIADLPPGKYEPLGRPLQISEEVAKGLVGWFEIAGSVGYRDYGVVNDYRYLLSAHASLLSLIRAEGFNPEQVVILKII